MREQRTLLLALVCCGLAFEAPVVHAFDDDETLVLAKKRKRRSRKQKRKAKEKEVEAPPPAPAVEEPPAEPSELDVLSRLPDASEDTASVLGRARELYQALEYDRVIPLAEAVLARDGVSLDERLDAHLLQGSSLAIVGDPIEAEKAFRLLLRARSDFNMPASTPPKILAVFRKVQVEEQETTRLLEEALRRKVIAGLELRAEGLPELVGGFPVVFRYRLKDPGGNVGGMSVQYRRAGEPDYSSLAMRRGDDGEWVGIIPGEWTSNDDGFTLEYFVVTRDDKGPLIVEASAKEPNRADVAAGTVDLAKPPPLPLWSFLVGASGVGVLTAVGASLTAGVLLTQAEYNAMVEGSLTTPVQGSDLRAIADRGEAFTISQFVAYGAAGLAAVGVGVMAPFVNWTGREYVDVAEIEGGADEGAAPEAEPVALWTDVGSP